MYITIPRGNQEKFHGEAIVCFLDILGFSKAIVEKWSLYRCRPLEQIMRFKKNLPKFNSESIPEIHLDQAHYRYLCRIWTFSDSITICHGFEEDKTYGDVYCGALAVIGNALQVWRNAISEGFTLRGAIETGQVFWDRSELVGPAFIKTHVLESKWAKSSRIIIGSSFNKMIRSTIEKSPELQPHTCRYLLKDSDGYIIVNPQKLTEDHDKQSILESLIRMRDKCSDYFQKEKYRNLINVVQLNEDSTNLTIDQLGDY